MRRLCVSVLTKNCKHGCKRVAGKTPGTPLVSREETQLKEDRRGERQREAPVGFAALKGRLELLSLFQ